MRQQRRLNSMPREILEAALPQACKPDKERQQGHQKQPAAVAGNYGGKCRRGGGETG